MNGLTRVPWKAMFRLDRKLCGTWTLYHERGTMIQERIDGAITSPLDQTNEMIRPGLNVRDKLEGNRNRRPSCLDKTDRIQYRHTHTSPSSSRYPARFTLQFFSAICVGPARIVRLLMKRISQPSIISTSAQCFPFTKGIYYPLQSALKHAATFFDQEKSEHTMEEAGREGDG